MAVDASPREPPETPQTSSSRRLVHDGAELILDSDDDSDLSLEDVRVLLESARKPAPRAPSPAGPQQRKRRWDASAAAAPQAPVRLDIATLVRKRERERESRARIAEIERKLKDKSPAVKRGGEARVTADSIAEFVEDGGEEDRGRAKRLLRAMVRSGALGVEPAWCFFSEGGPTPEKRRAFPAACFPREPWADHLMQGGCLQIDL
jgi:hypothetical protein